MRRMIFIVSPDRPELLEALQKAMEREPNVEVVSDRRSGQEPRRRGNPPPTIQRRLGDRRSVDRQLQIDKDLAAYGWTVVRVEL